MSTICYQLLCIRTDFHNCGHRIVLDVFKTLDEALMERFEFLHRWFYDCDVYFINCPNDELNSKFDGEEGQTEGENISEEYLIENELKYINYNDMLYEGGGGELYTICNVMEIDSSNPEVHESYNI